MISGASARGQTKSSKWLGPNAGDRIDVYTRQAGEKTQAYHLTLLMAPGGQIFIQIKKIDDQVFNNVSGVPQGTAVIVSVKETIPHQTQAEIMAGIRQNFPFITDVDIETKMEGQEGFQKLNGFGKTQVLVPEGGVLPQNTKGSRIEIALDSHSIKLIDNGDGMEDQTIARMFVPQQGDKHPQPLTGEALEQELAKLGWIYDETRPQKVSFARNGPELAVSVDVPDKIVPSAVVPGTLMLQLGRLLPVAESWDKIRIPLNLKPDEPSLFEKGVETIIDKLIAHTGLTDEAKLKYINTIINGLEGLLENDFLEEDGPVSDEDHVQGNEHQAKAINDILTYVQSALKDVVANLKAQGYVFLPDEKQYENIDIFRHPERSEGSLKEQPKGVIYLNKNIFNWQGAADMEALGAKRVRGITLRGAQSKLPLLIMPFKPQALAALTGMPGDWYSLKGLQRVPMLLTDSFIALPSMPGTERLLALAQKDHMQLSQDEKEEINSLKQIVNIVTAKEVVTSYEVARPKDNLLDEENQPFEQSQGRPDSKAINTFFGQITPARDRSCPAQSSPGKCQSKSGFIGKRRSA